MRKSFDGARSLAVDTSPQMLQAGWELYEGEYFAARTKISAKELDYLTRRLMQASFASTGLTGFSFDAFVKINIDREMTDQLEKRHCIWLETVFYVCLGLTIAFGVLSIVMSVLSVMKAQRMALHGNVDHTLLQKELPMNLGYEPGAIGDGYTLTTDEVEQRMQMLSQELLMKESDDMQKAISALHKVQPIVLGSIALSLGFFVCAAVAMAWIKTIWKHQILWKHFNATAAVLTSIIGALIISIFVAFFWMNQLFIVRTFHQSGLRPRAVVPPNSSPANASTHGTATASRPMPPAAPQRQLRSSIQ